MLTKKDKRFFESTQENFPLVSRPYAVLAERYGISEAAFLKHLRHLKKKKIVRYAGTIFNMRKLGIRSSLVAMRVPKPNLKKAVRIINEYPHVSHNYLRDDAYNVWFTISAVSEPRCRALVAEIKKRTGIFQALNLKTTKVFKSRAVFDW